MNLSIAELALLRATPFPYDPNFNTPDERSEIHKRAEQILGIDSVFDIRTAMKVLDQLEISGLIERVAIGYCRRTIEGDRALKNGIEDLQGLRGRLLNPEFK